MNIVRRDEKKSVDALLRITYWEEEPDRNELERDVAEFMDQHLYRPLKELEVGKLLQQILEMATKHGLRLNPNLFLMMKAFCAVEAVGRGLDPNFDIIRQAEPFVRRIQLGRFNPKRVADEMMDAGIELARLLTEVPGGLRAIFKQAKEGTLKIEIGNHGLAPMLSTHERISNRVAFAIVLASLIIGSSLIARSDIPPKWHEIPIIGLVGFVVAGVMGVWLLASMLRSGRM
jgi:ubiquinone biosynthesis protein